jgi:hypothetical protein
LLFGIDMAGDKVNYHLLHSDGDISHYLIDKEHKSCLQAYHLETVQDQRSMSDGPKGFEYLIVLFYLIKIHK